MRKTGGIPWPPEPVESSPDQNFRKAYLYLAGFIAVYSDMCACACMNFVRLRELRCVLSRVGLGTRLMQIEEPDQLKIASAGPESPPHKHVQLSEHGSVFAIAFRHVQTACSLTYCKMWTCN